MINQDRLLYLATMACENASCGDCPIVGKLDCNYERDLIDWLYEED